MSIHPLGLSGWDELSTWGWDDAAQSWYTQLTPNGGGDRDGPRVWLADVPTPYRTEVELMVAIIQSTGAQLVEVLNAMRDKIGKR